MALRDTPDAFDKAFLAALFDRDEGALRGFGVEPVGTGQVGDSFRISLDWVEAPDGPASLVAKCPAADMTSRETARNLHLYEIETQFYAHFGKSCGARVPQTYAVDYDAQTGDGVLLFEDMAPAKQIAQMDGCSVSEVKLILDEAARLHQSHWNDPVLEQTPWLTYGQQEERRAFLIGVLPALYPDWQARYQDRLSDDILQMGAALVERFEAYSAPRPGPKVLTHGDMRLDNMLFTDTQGRAVLLDWQTASCANPMGDIAYAVSTSLADPKQRADAEEALVVHYHAALGACVGDYDVAAAWADYRRASFAGFIMAVFSAMMVERTERGDEMFAVMAERSAWQALHLDALSLI
ncbi:MAG: phosphotransferase family protein [Parvibaculales bacterium]